MSVTTCTYCDNQYDQDTNVEHEEACKEMKNKQDRENLLNEAIALGRDIQRNGGVTSPQLLEIWREDYDQALSQREAEVREEIMDDIERHAVKYGWDGNVDKLYRKLNMKSKYTPEQIEECKRYLSYGAKNNHFDEDFCEDIIEREAWDEVYELMAKGDAAYEASKEG